MQVEITNEEAKDLADEILLRGEFIPARDPGFFREGVNQVFEWIAEFLDWLFGGIFGAAGGGAGSLIAYILAGVAAVLIILAIVKAVRGYDKPEKVVEGTGTRVVFDEVVDPAVLRQDLASASASGDWRAAVIAGFRLAIVQMIDRRIVAERPGATTGDFGRALAAKESFLASSYRPASGAFERAFYSDNEITEQDLSSVRTLLGQLEPAGVS
jgi:hypothetical protein